MLLYIIVCLLVGVIANLAMMKIGESVQNTKSDSFLFILVCMIVLIMWFFVTGVGIVEIVGRIR